MPLSCPSCSSVSSPPARTGTRETGDQSSQSPPIHSQSHLLSGQCLGVRDLFEECDPSDDQSLATFFMKVVARNMEINGEDDV